jgi:hypothetical protein
MSTSEILGRLQGISRESEHLGSRKLGHTNMADLALFLQVLRESHSAAPSGDASMAFPAAGAPTPLQSPHI